MKARRTRKVPLAALIALLLCSLLAPAAGLAASSPASAVRLRSSDAATVRPEQLVAPNLGPLAARRPAKRRAASASHFVLIMLENRELGEVIGNGTAPYVEALAKREALASDYHAITHPSLPNYIALLAGDPLGISSDCTECVAHGVNLVDQLQAAHIGWRAYMQSMPGPCYRGAEAGAYAKKHDPFLYFPQIASDPARCRSVVPLGRLQSDLRDGALPRFAWITPNLCDDGHNCENSAPNRFLAHYVPSLLAHLGRNGVLAIVWDEGTTNSGCCSMASGGTVPLILAGPKVRHRFVLRTPADHYSLLALIEREFGLKLLRGAACSCTPSLAPMFVGGKPPHL